MQKLLIKKRNKGFTLIELIVVIAVIAILVLLATPKFLDYTRDAKIAQIKNDIKVAEEVIEEYLIKNNDTLPGILTPIDLSTPLGEEKLWETKGVATSIKGDAGSYVDITEMNEIKQIKSKLPGQFAANNDGKVYYVHTSAINIGDNDDDGDGDGDVVNSDPYTYEKIATLIGDGWIPVANADELNQIRQDGVTLTFGAGTDWEDQYEAGYDKSYLQVANIDLGVAPYNTGEGWNPIGIYTHWANPETRFTGNYDGGNYSINNLYINRPGVDYAGLFKKSDSNATFKNIRINDALIENVKHSSGVLIGVLENSIVDNVIITNATMNINTDGWCNGILSGDNYTSSVSNVFTSGTINANAEGAGQLGGISGYISGVLVENVHADVDITDTTTTAEQVGGLFGSADNLTVNKSSSSGNINGSMYVGGLAGDFYENAEITNSYSDGDVSGVEFVGGFVGYIWKPGVFLMNTHAFNSVNGTSNVGGYAGYKRDDCNASNCLIARSYHKGLDNGLGTAVTADAMSNPETFENWDFDSIWGIDSSKGYPTFVDGVDPFNNVKKIDTGGSSSYLLTKSGNLYAWGANGYGQLGDGTYTNSGTPKKVNLPGLVIDVAAGGDHVLAILENGDVYAWGRNNDAQIARPVDNPTRRNLPAKIDLPGPAIRVYANVSASLVELENGDVYGFGDGNEGSLGLGEDIYEVVTPTLLPWITDYKSIVMGPYTTYVIKNDGILYGSGAITPSLQANDPINVSTEMGLIGAVDAIGAGDGFTLVELADGKAYAWGNNYYGELGRGSFAANFSYQPLAEVNLPLMDIKYLEGALMSSSYALSEDGNLFGWGYNESGQLGIATTTNTASPSLIGLPGLAEMVSSGYDHTIVVLNDGRVFTAGWNAAGELGRGVISSSNYDMFQEISKFYYFK